MEFHEKLQALRKQKGLTQEELAQALYVSRTAVSKWESGRGYPNIDSLKVIAAYFSVSMDELLLGAEKKKQPDGRRGDMVFASADLCAALLMLLPLFAIREGGAVRAASLLSLAGDAPFRAAMYAVILLGMGAAGVLTVLSLRGRCTVRQRYVRAVSLALNAAGALAAIAGLQPYAAAALLALAAVKAMMLAKRP